MEHNGLCIDLIKISIYTSYQLFFRLDPNTFEHLFGHLAEERFDKVQPGGMLRCKYKLETAFDSGQILDDFLSFMDLKVVEHEPDRITLWILGICIFRLN